jgi:hypothetical protein
MRRQQSHEIHKQQSTSTMDTQIFLQGKPLPRPPLVYIPGYEGPFVRKKVVVVGNFSCGKTSLITYGKTTHCILWDHHMYIRLTSSCNQAGCRKVTIPRYVHLPPV